MTKGQPFDLLGTSSRKYDSIVPVGISSRYGFTSPLLRAQLAFNSAQETLEVSEKNASEETIAVMLRVIGQKVDRNVSPDRGEELKAFRAKAVVAGNDEQSTASKIFNEKMTSRIPSEEYQANGSHAEQAQRKRVKHCTIRKTAIPIQMQWLATANNEQLGS